MNAIINYNTNILYFLLLYCLYKSIYNVNIYLLWPNNTIINVMHICNYIITL